MEEVQTVYENVVSLCSTNDLCYRKQMERYRKYIEENFNVQWILEFPDWEYWAKRPITRYDTNVIDNELNKNR